MFKPILVARGGKDRNLLPKMANRHGLVAGATGTGKTVTLQLMAESFSKIGVPVFMADVKGDLSGICMPGSPNPKIDVRIKQLGLTGHSFSGCPVTFWDILGELGHPVRTTISECWQKFKTGLFKIQNRTFPCYFEFEDFKIH